MSHLEADKLQLLQGNAEMADETNKYLSKKEQEFFSMS
jgi:hypothetical protein